MDGERARSTVLSLLRQVTQADRRIPRPSLRRPSTGRSMTQATTDDLTVGQHLADRVTGVVGSWPFIAAQSLLLLLWIALNTLAWRQHWDPYPFILLNLVLSFQAAFTAPIILMSQNRQTAMDRDKAEADYAVDRQAERDIAAVHARLDELSGPQWDALVQIQRQQLELLDRLEALTRERHRVTIERDNPEDADHLARRSPASAHDA
jgi:uncharacterized membrane protein